MYTVKELKEVVKAYDIRGLVATQLTPEFVFDVGAAFATLMQTENSAVPAIVVGYDMRESSEELADSFIRGILSTGLSVKEVGLVSTDALYFASGKLNLPGAMFTASHNPAGYNGIKLCRAGAKPIGEQTGLNKISEYLLQLPERVTPISSQIDKNLVEKVDIIPAYRDCLLKLVDITRIRPLKLAVDAGNGMAGRMVPKVFEKVPNISIHGLFFELDGSFPNHEANPMDPKNIRDLQNYIKNNSVDLGLAFDGDADRCFIIDETGEPVSPSIVTALVAKSFLTLNPGATIIHNLITSKIVPETILANNGKPIRTRVGHSFIKQAMQENQAVFGGEHSAHYYFKDFWNADSGLLAALHVIKLLGESKLTLSELVKPYKKYANSGEINTKVADPDKKIKEIVDSFGEEVDTTDDLDGVTVQLQDGSWFNLRLSNTESLLRLNVEASDENRVREIVQHIKRVFDSP